MPRSSLRQRLRDALQTLVLLSAAGALGGLLGWTLLGPPGLWGLVLAPLLAVLGRGASPRLVLRLTRASPVAPEEAPGLYQLAAGLAERARLARVPQLYYLPSRALNAFAAGGPGEPAIVVTDGLLRSLTKREVAAVLAHELGHLRADDVWVMTLADVVARITLLLSVAGQALLLGWIVFALVSGASVPFVPLLLLVCTPALASAVELALSRTREYDADRAAAELTGDAAGLAAALEKLERFQGGWIERVFMTRASRWLGARPSTAERTRRLRALEDLRAPALAALDYGSGSIFDRPVVVRLPRWHWSGLWY